MVEHEDEPVTEGEQASTATFDLYRSLTYPNLMIFVAKDVVPPFRFKARRMGVAKIYGPRASDEDPYR
jgi:hypothetical protein